MLAAVHLLGKTGSTAAGPWAGEQSIGSDLLKGTGNDIPQRLLTTVPRCGIYVSFAFHWNGVPKIVLIEKPSASAIFKRQGLPFDV